MSFPFLPGMIEFCSCFGLLPLLRFGVHACTSLAHQGGQYILCDASQHRACFSKASCTVSLVSRIVSAELLESIEENVSSRNVRQIGSNATILITPEGGCTKELGWRSRKLKAQKTPVMIKPWLCVARVSPKFELRAIVNSRKPRQKVTSNRRIVKALLNEVLAGMVRKGLCEVTHAEPSATRTKYFLKGIGVEEVILTLKIWTKTSFAIPPSNIDKCCRGLSTSPNLIWMSGSSPSRYLR